MTRSAPTAAEFDGTKASLYQAIGFSGTNFFVRMGVTFDDKEGYPVNILVGKALTSSHTYGRIEYSDSGFNVGILRNNGPVVVTQPPRLASDTFFQSLANRPLLDRVRIHFKDKLELARGLSQNTTPAPPATPARSKRAATINVAGHSSKKQA
jgi:hypothetical protein